MESYAGMTVNERLFASKLTDEFDAAAHRGDRGHMISILVRIHLNEVQAARTADAILETPEMYGY